MSDDARVAVAIAGLLDEMSPGSLAPLLRSWADRLEPTSSPAAPDSSWKTRDEVRAFQIDVLQMIQDYFSATPRSDGLLWFPSSVLKSARYFLDHELKLRGDDFDAIERDPTVRLR